MYEIEHSDCNCCTSITVSTPVQISNLPGLPAIAYRVGTYTQFKASMQTRLSDSDLPGLNALRTRQSDDFTIALLDSWAMVCDVLTFYQERIANESYKRTAIERASLLELARLVRYNLQPGVAADTYLAFTLDETPGSPGYANIDIGTQAQSLPGPGEQPETFEVSESIVAYAQWNAITPIQTQPQLITPSIPDIWLVGASVNLKPGDILLIANNATNQPTLRYVQGVNTDAKTQQTHVYLNGYKPSTASQTSPKLISEQDKKDTIARAFQQRQPLTDNVVQQVMQNGATQSQLEALAVYQGWSPGDLFANIAAQSTTTSTISQTWPMTTGEQASAATQIFVLRLKASMFGQNAPDWRLIPKSIQDLYTAGHTLPPGQSKWTDWPFTPPDTKTLDLDRVYNQILVGSWVVIERPGVEAQFAQVQQVQETTGSNYGLNVKVTRLLLDRDIKQPQTLSELRQVTIYTQSELLTLVDLPATTPIQGNQITINGVFKELGEGRRLVVTGQRTDAKNVSASEFVTLDHIEPLPGNRSMLYLQNDGLSNSYIPTTVTINGNVVAATQGESIQNEILGSGDASQAFQSFTLQQFPLTYVQASTPDGRASTLSVFIDGIEWQEVDTLYGHGPYEHIFITHIGDDQKVTIQFGDGRTGARLTTGEDNVVASYRTGAGSQGLVKPGQISLLQTQPLGVKGVSNPLTPTGAVDPDTIEDARRNADNTVQTLGRIVSVSDYENFARSYAAVAKARATLLWNNQTKGVYITIAGPATLQNQTGTVIEQGSGIYNKIYSGMRKASDPTIPLFLLSYTAPFFRVAAQVKVQPDHDTETVLKAVEQAIRSAFSFDARTFGQPVYLKEVIAVTQSVPGVVTIRFTMFYRVDQLQSTRLVLNGLDTNPYLEAALPHQQSDGSISLAELLIIDPVQPFDILEVMP